ncbi:MAG TPA: zinc metallopeptidase [Caulifigura sp.]|nr:zinc metallopeptidase [Caulifigura sp.]
MPIYNVEYLLWISPALILMMWAQWRIRSAYARGMEVPASLSGAAAAQHILDSSGLDNVAIEVTDGVMSDHYDPTQKVLRLSREVYSSRTATAVGIAAHEAGHALQDATNYAPMGIRNMAVPAANFGSGFGMILLVIGYAMASKLLLTIGIVAFSGVVFFQLINLPVEFDASNRAKRVLTDLGIVDQDGSGAVRSVLNAAAWTYVAGTLQSVLTLLYYVSLIAGGHRRDE